MKFFVEDFCGTLQARVVIFGMQVDDDVMYCGIANQPFDAYSSQYLSSFPSFQTELYPRFEKVGVYWFTSVLPSLCPSFRLPPPPLKCFVKDFFTTMPARVVIFSIQMDEKLMYRGIASQPSAAYSSRYLSDFLSFHTLNNEIFRRRLLWNPTS